MADASRWARKRWVRTGFVALVAAALYLPWLGTPALWEPDEGRYAEIAREMVLTGDDITPRDNFVRYFEKPPLSYWAEAASIRLFGANEFAVRLPAALFTVAEVSVTAVIGEVMFDELTGFCAALILALCPIVFAFARVATLDPALAFFLTAAIGTFYRASESDFGSGRGRLWMIAASAMLALGTLAKGPVALFLGGTIGLAWLLLEGRTREILRMPLLWCVGVYIIIAAPWFVIAERRNPGFLHFFFVHEHLQRFLSSQEHGWGPYFFIPIIIAGTWPWLLFIPSGVSLVREVPAGDRRQAALKMLALWFAVIFIFFSIPRSKLGSYILPATPPIAILAGLALSSLGDKMERERALRLVRSFAIANIVVGTIALAVLVFLSERLPPALARDSRALAIVLVAVSAGGWFFAACKKDPTQLRSWAVSGMVVSMLFVGPRIIYDASALNSYRSLAQQIEPHRGCTIASYRHFVQSVPFYTGQREVLVEYWGELAEFDRSQEEREDFIGTAAKLEALWSSDRCVVLIANRQDFGDLSKFLSPAPAIIGCEGKKLALYNRSAGPTPPGCTPANAAGTPRQDPIARHLEMSQRACS